MASHPWPLLTGADGTFTVGWDSLHNLSCADGYVQIDGSWIVQDGYKSMQNVSDYSDKFAPMILDLQQKWAEQAPPLTRSWTVDADPELNKVKRSEPCLLVKL